MKKYYFNDGKAQYGPFTIEELKAKGIDRNTPVWYEGLPEWTKAGDISEISSYFPPSIANNTPPPITVSPKTKKRNYTALYVIIAIVVLGFAYVFIHDFILTERIKAREETEQNIMEGSLDLNEEVPTTETSATIDENKEAARIAEEKERVLKLLICANFQQYFTAKIVSADVHDFGGMSDVFIEVRNLTDYHAEEVNLHLSYLKENGDTWKEERIRVTHVSPRQSMTVQAPGSHRGNKIRTRVEYVESKALGLHEGYGYK